MKPKTFLFIMALAGIIVSCIPSLYPLYREKDLMVNDKLEGIFGDFDGIFGEDDDDYWEIRRLGPDIVKDLKGGYQKQAWLFEHQQEVRDYYHSHCPEATEKRFNLRRKLLMRVILGR